jgi:hypothetical protein
LKRNGKGGSGIDDFDTFAHGGKFHGVKLASFDCMELKKRKPADLIERDRPALNFCLRLMTRDLTTSWVDWIDRGSGWIACPIYEGDIKSVKDVFAWVPKK